jgi:iron complex outermembrane recepter protein
LPAGTSVANYAYVVPAGFPTTGAIPTNAVYAPFRSVYNYSRVLPNVGLTFRPVDSISLYASYAKGLSAPRTDNLYRAPSVIVAPETTDNFDAGIRFNTALVRASFGGFYNRFQNRIVTAFDPITTISVDRNVGRVEIKGLEASVGLRPFKWLTLNGFGSYIDARYRDNVAANALVTLPLAGKRLVETPEWQYGYSARAVFGPLEVGATFKQITKRYATDLNDQAVPGYSIFDINARISLAELGLAKTFVQGNINNVFDTQYLGSISSQPSLGTNAAGLVTGLPVTAAIGGNNPTYQVGAPRSFVVSLQVGF